MEYMDEGAHDATQVAPHAAIHLGVGCHLIRMLAVAVQLPANLDNLSMHADVCPEEPVATVAILLIV